MVKYIVCVLLLAGCFERVDSGPGPGHSTDPAPCPAQQPYCAPWEGVIADTCTVLHSDGGTFGYGDRTACRTEDGTVWTHASDGWFTRYEALGTPTEPGAWVLNRELCEVAPDGTIIAQEVK